MALSLNGSTGISGINGSAGTPALQGGDADTGIFFGTDTASIATAGSERLIVDASGNINVDSGGVYYDAANNRLGIGTTNPAAQFQVGVGNTSTPNAKAVFNTANSSDAGIIIDNWTGGATTLGPRLKFSNSGHGEWYMGGGNGTNTFVIGYASDRLTIDSSGRLLVGTSNYSGNATIVTQGHSGNSNGAAHLLLKTGTTSPSDGASLGYLLFSDANTSGGFGAWIAVERDGGTWTSGSSMPGRLVFSTTPDGLSSPTERMRISSSGQVNIFSSENNGFDLRHAKTGAADTAFAVRNGATSITTGTEVMKVKGDGDLENINNSYGGLSDIKLKENVVDAASQWSDLKALQVRKYNFKPEIGYGTHTQIGLVAQEVELVSPGLVSESPDRDEEGNDLGTVTKSVNYSVLYMKAVKALQEAMERIETLEAKVAALEAQ